MKTNRYSRVALAVVGSTALVGCLSGAPEPVGGWGASGNMTVPRELHRALTLLDGRVLVVGLTKDRLGLLTDIYDPSSGTFAPTQAPSRERGGSSATLLFSGEVLIAGGEDVAYTKVPYTDLYDPKTGTWSERAQMLTARSAHSATLLLDGRVLVAGGETDQSITEMVEIFDPRTSVWTPAPPMLVARKRPAAALLPDGRVLVAGGMDASIKATSAAEIYQPGAGAWSQAAALTLPHTTPQAVTLLDGTVLINGWNGAERYDVAHDKWSIVSGELRPEDTTTLLQDGSVLFCGDLSDGRNAALFEWSTQRFLPTRRMREWRSGAAVAALTDGRAIVTGGINDEIGSVLSSTEVFSR